MQLAPSAQNVSIKLAATFILLFIDIIFNTFVEASFTLSSETVYYTNFYVLVHP